VLNCGIGRSAFAKVYDAKVPVTAADCLNDRVLPFFDQRGVPFLRILTDRGTEYCGKDDEHPYKLYLALNEIEHSRTKHPQTNGICEDETVAVAPRTVLVASQDQAGLQVEALQASNYICGIDRRDAQPFRQPLEDVFR